MSAAIALSDFEAVGWTFRLQGNAVKARPPATATAAEVSAMRQHRTRLRSLLAIRSGDLVRGDLLHDAACIADRDGSAWPVALDGAAISHGFADWSEAETILNISERLK